MKRTLISLTKEQHEALTRITEETLAPMSALVRRAVEQYLERQQSLVKA